jgi:hypothetical protein
VVCSLKNARIKSWVGLRLSRSPPDRRRRSMGANLAALQPTRPPVERSRGRRTGGRGPAYRPRYME